MVEIISLDHNGRGIGYINNKVIFVENTIPGDIVDIEVIKDKKKYSEGKAIRFIKKSPNRIENPCPYFNDCGGCDLLNIGYNDQLIFKQNKIKNIISKYLDSSIKINNIVECDNNFFYRNKTTFHVNENIGFYKNKTYNIVPVDNCLISSKIINKSISYLKQLDLSKIKNIICRASDNQLMIIIETEYMDLDISPIKSIASSIYLKNNNNYFHIYKNKYIEEKIGNYKYLISPDSFFQVNINICYKLYSKINEYVGTNKNVLDLYCGTGSISIFVNKQNNVLGVEINENSIKDAIRNSKINNINNINFICGDSGSIIKETSFNPDVIIVDPPRSGLNKQTILNIINLNAEKIIYVSCDPMTFVRDLNLLNEKYEIKEITPFDMFPNTKHVESLALLKLKTK